MQFFVYIICVFQIFVIPLHQQVKITDYLLRLLPYPFGIAYIPTKSESKQVSTNKVIINRFINLQTKEAKKQKQKSNIKQKGIGKRKQKPMPRRKTGRFVNGERMHLTVMLSF